MSQDFRVQVFPDLLPPVPGLSQWQHFKLFLTFAKVRNEKCNTGLNDAGAKFAAGAIDPGV